MKSFNRKLCALLLFNLFLIFSFCCSSNAFESLEKYSVGDVQDTSVWTFINQTDDPTALELVEKCKATDYYASGNYYYFVGGNSISDNSFSNVNYFACLIPKSNSWVTPITVSGLVTIGNGDFAYGFRPKMVTSTFKYVSGMDKGSVCVSGPIVARTSHNSLDFVITKLDKNTRKAYYTLLSNFDRDIVFNNKGTLVPLYSGQPYISNSDSGLQHLSNSHLMIFPNNSSTDNFKFRLICCENENSPVTLIDMDLSFSSENYEKYHVRSDPFDDGSSFLFYIPFEDLGDITLQEGIKYNWQIEYTSNGQNILVDRFIYSSVTKNFLSIGSEEGDNPPEEDNSNKELQNSISESTDKIVESNKETQNKLQEQTEAIRESNETNKNIFQKIGDIFSILNPFSENFFAYRLLDLLFEGLKSFILPSSDFLSNFFDELSQWFRDRLGFLWTPFDIINDFLEKFNNDTLFGEPIIHIPNIQEPVTGEILINSVDLNLNDVRNNETFRTIHDIYLSLVDFIIYVSLVIFSYNTLVSVFRGTPDSITSVTTSENDRAFEQAQYSDKVKSFRKRG